MHVRQGDGTLVINKSNAATGTLEHPSEKMICGAFAVILAFNHPERRLWPS